MMMVISFSYIDLYNLLGKCYEMLDNRSMSLRLFVIALQIDLGCVESAEQLVKNGLVSSKEMKLCLDACTADTHNSSKNHSIYDRGLSSSNYESSRNDCTDITGLFDFHSAGSNNLHRSYLQSYYQ